MNLAVFYGENVGGGAFGDFAAFVEEDDFVETCALRFGYGPDVGEPGDAFYSGEGRGGVASVRAETEADGLAIFGEWRGIDDEVGLGLRLVAAPESDLVVDEIDAGGAFGDIVCANHFVEMDADFGGGIRHRETD